MLRFSHACIAKYSMMFSSLFLLEFSANPEFHRYKYLPTTPCDDLLYMWNL